MVPASHPPAARLLVAAFAAIRRHLADAALFSAVLNLLYLAPTLYMLQVYDRVVPTRGLGTLAMLTALFLLAAITVGVLDLVRTRLLIRAAIRLDRLLGGAILARLLARGGDRRSSSTLREFDTFRQTVTGTGILALFDAPWCPIYILVCFVVHPAIGGLALGGAVVLFVLSLLNERATAASLTRAGTAAGASYAAIDEMMAGAEAVRGLGMAEALVARGLRQRHESSDLQTAASFRSATFVSLTKSVRFVLQSIGLGLGAWLAVRGSISPGAIFAASLLIARALQPIELVTGSWRHIVQARVTYAAMCKLFGDPARSGERTRLPAPIGHVEVTGLTILPPGSDRPVLNGVTLTLSPGEVVGIVGQSGAGKSTLVRALVGALTPTAGTIRLDGASLADWPEDQLGRAIGYLPQAPTLFRGTVKENVARFDTELRDPGEIDADLVRAAQRAGAHQFILRLPQGYETEIGGGGVRLSAGQAQRIALARALYGNPRFVVLDEPNAALDSEGESCLDDALAELRAGGASVVVVAHHGNVLARADRLIVLRDGRVEKIGMRAAQLSPAAA
jgi:PrtD family type I secretion system ABC transporter